MKYKNQITDDIDEEHKARCSLIKFGRRKKQRSKTPEPQSKMYM